MTLHAYMISSFTILLLLLLRFLTKYVCSIGSIVNDQLLIYPPPPPSPSSSFGETFAKRSSLTEIPYEKLYIRPDNHPIPSKC